MKWHIDPSKIVITDKLVRKCAYHNNGQRWTEEYYLNDRFLSKEEYDRLTL